MADIVRVNSAIVNYSNGDMLTVVFTKHTEKGNRYSWTLMQRNGHSEKSDGEIIGENPDVSGLHAALVGAAAIHHPAKKGK